MSKQKKPKLSNVYLMKKMFPIVNIEESSYFHL